MIALGNVGALELMIDGLYIVDGLCALLMEHREELPHHARDDHSVVRGAVVVELGQAEVVGDDIELEALELRQQRLRQRERIEEHRRELQPLPVRRSGHKADVKMRIVRDDGTVADEVDEHLHGFFFLGRARNVAVADAGERGDLVVHFLKIFGPDEDLELVRDLLLLRHAHGADLHDLAAQRRGQRLLRAVGPGPRLVPLHIQNDILHTV